MKYLKEKKEFEKKCRRIDRKDGGVGFVTILGDYDLDYIWSWITSKFQSHDRKMLGWVLKEVVGENETEDILGILGTKHKDGEENETRNELRAKQRQLINQKIKEVMK